MRTTKCSLSFGFFDMRTIFVFEKSALKYLLLVSYPLLTIILLRDGDLGGG
jgi:hypothetical protein